MKVAPATQTLPAPARARGGRRAALGGSRRITPEHADAGDALRDGQADHVTDIWPLSQAPKQRHVAERLWSELAYH